MMPSTFSGGISRTSFVHTSSLGPTYIRQLSNAAAAERTRASSPYYYRNHPTLPPLADVHDAFIEDILADASRYPDAACAPLPPSVPRKTIRSKASAKRSKLDSPAFSMRNVAESPWLQEVDTEGAESPGCDKPALLAARYDWRQPCFSRVSARRSPDLSPSKERWPKRYMPLIKLVAPGEAYYEGIQSYRSR